jgi:hypothetical protein
MSKAAKDVRRPSWNVLTTGWMEAMDLNGRSRLVAPLSALHDAQDLHRIVAPNALDLFAAHRFLITLLYWKADACGGVEKLRSRLLSGAVPPAVLRELKAEGGAFDLFDPKKPFLQDPTSKTAKLLPPSSLFAEMASGTNIAHFHHGDDDFSRLCMRCAIKGLARLVPWTQSGGRGKPPSVHGAPPIMAIAIGATLCETLGLNLVPLDGPFGKPQWSGQFRPAKKTKTVPLMEALTWNPRRVHLLEPRSPAACGYCGTNSIETVGQIVFLGNEACEKDESYVAAWRDPAAFYRAKDGKTTKTSSEDDAAIGSDLRRLFLQRFGSKEEPAPESKLLEANAGHERWLVILPCTNPAHNKSYDHRLVQLGIWPDAAPQRSKDWPDIPLVAGDRRALRGLGPIPASKGALAFAKAAARLKDREWALVASVADGSLGDSAAAFDVFTSIYWPLRNREASVPSREAAWMTLKLMATARNREHSSSGSVRPWEALVLHQPEQRSRNGMVRAYPRRIPRSAQLEQELRKIIHRNADRSIDWAGLCQFLTTTLA